MEFAVGLRDSASAVLSAGRRRHEELGLPCAQREKLGRKKAEVGLLGDEGLREE